MTAILRRRSLLAGAGASILLAACARTARAPEPESGRLSTDFAHRLAALEASAGGRLGVALYASSGERLVAHRGDERFGMCSTFKLPLAALILAAADSGELHLDQPVRFGEADMLDYAPVTRLHLASGSMSVSALAQAAQETSDNVAANLLLRLIDGPAGFTRRMRALGDPATWLDDVEPAMNLVMPGTAENTTTPAAMARSVAHFLGADSPLSPASRQLLGQWLQDTRTGMKRLRAGLPADWTCGDKTGTASDNRPGGMVNKTNDVAVVWRPDGGVIVIAAYYDAPGRYDGIRPEDENVLASVGTLAGAWISGLG